MSPYARFVFRLCAALLFHGTTRGQPPEILINEFRASNETTNRDPEFQEFSDWIELYNAAREAVDLSGCYLTDNSGEPMHRPSAVPENIPGPGHP